MKSSMGEPCKERALVFAGAFNPITIAHLERARYALSYVHYDKVVFVPSKSSYIKNIQEKDFAYSDKERLEGYVLSNKTILSGKSRIMN